MDAAPAALVARRRLTSLERPFVVCVLTDRDVASAAATIARALYAGADAFELNVPLLASEPVDAVTRLIGACPRPVYTSCRRASFMSVYGRGPVPEWPDDERMHRQLALVAGGAVAIDVELDAFADEELGGVARDEDAVRRQRGVADSAHAAGAQVIFSCHSRDHFTRADVRAVAETAADRGADLVKVVAAAETTNDALELVAGAAALRDSGAVPTTVIGAGRAGRFTRVLAPILGGGWVLCQEDILSGGFAEQPPVGEARDVLRILSALEAVPGG